MKKIELFMLVLVLVLVFLPVGCTTGDVVEPPIVVEDTIPDIVVEEPDIIEEPDIVVEEPDIVVEEPDIVVEEPDIIEEPKFPNFSDKDYGEDVPHDLVFLIHSLRSKFMQMEDWKPFNPKADFTQILYSKYYKTYSGGEWKQVGDDWEFIDDIWDTVELRFPLLMPEQTMPEQTMPDKPLLEPYLTFTVRYRDEEKKFTNSLFTTANYAYATPPYISFTPFHYYPDIEGYINLGSPNVPKPEYDPYQGMHPELAIIIKSLISTFSQMEDFSPKADFTRFSINGSGVPSFVDTNWYKTELQFQVTDGSVGVNNGLFLRVIYRQKKFYMELYKTDSTYQNKIYFHYYPAVDGYTNLGLPPR